MHPLHAQRQKIQNKKKSQKNSKDIKISTDDYGHFAVASFFWYIVKPLSVAESFRADNQVTFCGGFLPWLTKLWCQLNDEDL